MPQDNNNPEINYERMPGSNEISTEYLFAPADNEELIIPTGDNIGDNGGESIISFEDNKSPVAPGDTAVDEFIAETPISVGDAPTPAILNPLEAPYNTDQTTPLNAEAITPNGLLALQNEEKNASETTINENSSSDHLVHADSFGNFVTMPQSDTQTIEGEGNNQTTIENVERAANDIAEAEQATLQNIEEAIANESNKAVEIDTIEADSPLLLGTRQAFLNGYSINPNGIVFDADGTHIGYVKEGELTFFRENAQEHRDKYLAAINSAKSKQDQADPQFEASKQQIQLESEQQSPEDKQSIEDGNTAGSEHEPTPEEILAKLPEEIRNSPFTPCIIRRLNNNQEGTELSLTGILEEAQHENPDLGYRDVIRYVDKTLTAIPKIDRLPGHALNGAISEQDEADRQRQTLTASMLSILKICSAQAHYMLGEKDSALADTEDATIFSKNATAGADRKVDDGTDNDSALNSTDKNTRISNILAKAGEKEALNIADQCKQDDINRFENTGKELKTRYLELLDSDEQGEELKKLEEEINAHNEAIKKKASEYNKILTFQAKGKNAAELESAKQAKILELDKAKREEEQSGELEQQAA